MQQRIDSKSERYSFDSLAELARYIETAPVTWRTLHSSTGNAPERDWDLSAGYDRAWTMAREGWNEGAQRAQEALKAFVPATPLPDCVTDIYGFRPHVPRFCAGAPDSMIRHRRDAPDGGGRCLTLYVPIGAHCGTQAERMANFGLGLAQYINQMETDGVRVEVNAMQSSKMERTRLTHTWNVKHADQPLDLAVLAFAIGHPAMYRRLGFALFERAQAPQEYGYGIPLNGKLSDLINPPAGAIILNGMKEANETSATPEKALAYITAQIEAAIDNPEGTDK